MVTSTNMSCPVLPNSRTKLRLECLIASETARLAALVASLPWTSTPMPISVIQRLSAIGIPGVKSRKLLGGLAVGNALLHIKLQDVVEAIEGAAQRNAPGQLDDLGLREMLAQPREDFVACLVPVVGHRDGIFDHELVDSIEFGVVLVVQQTLGAISRNTLDRQLRLMTRDAVIALVQNRDRHQRKLQMTLRQHGLVGEIHQQRP